MRDYLAIGTEELGKPVKKGDWVQAKCGRRGHLMYGTTEDGKESKLLGFISDGTDSYLVSIEGRLLPGCEKING